MFGGVKFGIHFGDLDPNFPLPGSYPVTYVAVGGCTQSGWTVSPRTIIVE
jgi:hypothetical protein